MLVIRMQRTGRKGHAQFRVVVQDSRRTPSSGRVVAVLGSYNPHTKQTMLNKEKAELYLSHGAQPSDRVIRLLESEKIKLPKWVNASTKQQRNTKNPDKLRKNQPAEPVIEESEAPVEAESSAVEEEKAEKTENTPAKEEPEGPDKTDE